MLSDAVATVVALWRYPVKSMMGEQLNAAEVTDRGLLGDRAYALVDRETGKVASAKFPRKWPTLLAHRATYVDPPTGTDDLPAVRITLPDGRIVRSDDPDVDATLSADVGRDVALDRSAPAAPSLEEYWPDIEGLDHRDALTEEAMPPGTFFDLGIVHLLSTATLDELRQRYPEGRFEVRRFRPNVVVGALEGQAGFVENGWVGRALTIGDDVRLRIAQPCPRCVMTTVAQDDLPKDPGILRTAARHNDVNVGVYATVERPGRILRGDEVRLVPS
ncbi:MAG TPA: MOSC N-terminal beta barrel domain-containing protein [Candidatus Limnocylindria bacterium]|nr:MOSC N-terminal beta barrel domain-containing protein [Candidatus Limnocylindria bacterium]